MTDRVSENSGETQRPSASWPNPLMNALVDGLLIKSGGLTIERDVVAGVAADTLDTLRDAGYVTLPANVWDEAVAALREVCTFVQIETGHAPTVKELARVVNLCESIACKGSS